MRKDVFALGLLVEVLVVVAMGSKQVVEFLDEAADGRNELDESFGNEDDTKVIALGSTISHDVGNMLDNLVEGLVLSLYLF